MVSLAPRDLFGRGTLSPWQVLLAIPTVLLAPAVATAACAERSRFAVPCSVSLVLGGIVVPVAGHWTGLFGSSGWLTAIGFRDAGAAAGVHLVGAAAAIVCVALVGPRNGKYHTDGSASIIPGHNLPMVALGAALILVGWLPYAAMRTAPSPNGFAPLNALLAAAAGAVAATVLSTRQYGKIDVMLTISGMLAGLVSSAASGAAAPGWAALLIGAVSGLLVATVTTTFDLRLHIDDVGGLIVPHGTGAIVGLIAAAALAPGTALDHLRSLGVQLLGIACVVVLTVALTSLTLLVVRATTGLRSPEADEFDGLDLAEHDVNAHPDFQQTMIKSYHLREA
jgi:Amt family ammonium transporter